MKEVENLNQVASKIRELERENKDLVQQTAVDKKSLEALRQVISFIIFCFKVYNAKL